MALLFMDSMEHYVTADILKKWTGAITSIGIVSIAIADPTCPGGPGNYMRITSNDNGGPAYGVYKAFPSAQTVIAGGWFYPASFGSGAGTIFAFLDSASAQIDLRIGSTGALSVTRNGSVLGTSSLTLSDSVWVHIEMKVKIDNTTGTYEVRVNGVNWVSGTGADTQNTGNATVNQFAVTQTRASGGSLTPFMFVKGVYVLDNSGSVANDFLGQVRVTCLRPSAIGNYSDWTPTFGNNMGSVEDTVLDGDLSFNMASSAGQVDTYEIQDCPASSGTVYGIQHVMGARQDAGATRTIRAKQRSAGVDYNGTSQTLTTAYQFYLDARSVNPATSAGYTVADVDAMETGYELVS